jgi:hypothetical protein
MKNAHCVDGLEIGQGERADDQPGGGDGKDTFAG